MTDRDLISEALRHYAQAQMRESRSRQVTGPQYADYRANRRALARRADDLATEIEAHTTWSLHGGR